MKKTIYNKRKDKVFCKVDINNLVKIASEILKKYNLSSLDDVKLTRSKNGTNILDQICHRYFGNYKYQNKMRIYQIWRRNSQNFVEMLNKEVTNLTDQEKRFIFNVTKEEWINRFFDLVVCYEQRFKFKQEISLFLSEKLQEQNVKCWLKCKSNWFKKKESNKKSAPWWRGNFSCVDSKCLNTFLAEIQNCQNILQNNEEKNFIQIDIIWYQDSNQHLNFVLREPRCSGQERIQVAKNLVELGVMNTQINHVLGNIFDSNNIVNKRMA